MIARMQLSVSQHQLGGGRSRPYNGWSLPSAARLMTRSMIDNTVRRSNMVDGQLRPNKVSDSRVLGAMRALPRERFLPPALAALAYADQNVTLPDGRCMVAPMVLARLVQLADPAPGERALLVGAGTGYGAVVLAACGAAVVALEDNEDLLRIARTVVPALAPGLDADVKIVSGPLAAGWPAGAPYDLVFIEGGFEVAACRHRRADSPGWWAAGGRAAGGRADWPGRAGGAGRRGPGDQPAPGLRLRNPGAARPAPRARIRVLTPRIWPRDLVGSP